MKVIGIDIGTTSICGVVVSGLSGEHYIGGRTTAGTTFGITDVVVTDIWYM